jgi:hypothetical protein
LFFIVALNKKMKRALTLLLVLTTGVINANPKKGFLSGTKNIGDTTETATNNEKDPTENIDIQFVGDGNIQKSLSSGKDIPATTGIGVFMYKTESANHRFAKAMELEMTINIASNSDTITAAFNNNTFSNASEFGRYLLIPRSTKQGAYIDAKVYLKDVPKKESAKYKKWNQFWYGNNWFVPDGFRFTATGSNTTWAYNNKVLNATALYGKAGIFWEFLPSSFQSVSKDNFMSLTLGYSPAVRYLGGDVGQTQNDTFRSIILKTSDKLFFANEVSIGFRIKNIRAEAIYPFVFVKDSADNGIPGLTDGQLVLSISFIGGFSLKLD